MNQLLILLAAFAGSVLTAMIIMPWLLHLCHKHEITYLSDNKHFSIPRIGGMLFVPALAMGLAVSMLLRLHDGTINDTIKSSSFFIGLGVMVIYLIGIIDDIFGLNKWQKAVLLIITSIAFPLCGLYINDLYGLFGLNHIGHTTGFIFTMFATILIVKGIDALNDTDGLAGAICLVPLIVYCGIFFNMGYYSYATMAISLGGALLVYLYYNLFGDVRIGTKTYMGHAGALIMSYGIVYLTLKYAMDNRQVIAAHSDGLLLPFSMLIIPIFEYVRAWVISNWNGLTKEQHRSLYIQHRLEEKGLSQIRVMLYILAADILFIAINLLLHHIAGLGITWIIIIDIAVYVCWQIVSDKQKNAPVHEASIPLDFADYKGEEGLVSVIMPTYNSSRFAGESIESIIAQTYTNWELIITDDCSSDNTMEIIQGYAAKDSRIRIQKNKVNGGAGVSRDYSIASARGQYIAFCDSDDRWIPRKLELQLSFMKEKDVALSFAPYYSCDENDQYLGYISAPRRVNMFQMMCDNKMGFLTCIYDTNRLGKHPMPRQRKRQDHALLLNLLKICKYAYSVQEPLAHYRIHPGNMSGKKISLLKYNAQTYTAVFGWPKPLSYLFLFTFFLPTYFWKRTKNVLLTISRAIKN